NACRRSAQPRAARVLSTLLAALRICRAEPSRRNELDRRRRSQPRRDRRIAQPYARCNARVHFAMSQTGTTTFCGVVRTRVWAGRGRDVTIDDAQDDDLWLDALAGRATVDAAAAREAQELRNAMLAREIPEADVAETDPARERLLLERARRERLVGKR